MLELNEDNFNKEIKENKLLVIDCWAIWCQPCLMMGPIFEELSKEMRDVKFAKLNVDDNQDIAQRLGVMGIPTFIIFKDGKEVGRTTGAAQKSIIKSKIEVAFK